MRKLKSEKRVFQGRLDSHWKAAYEMVHRVKLAMSQYNLSDSEVYQRCMEALTTHEGTLGEIGVDFPFTLPELEAQQDPSYTPFDSEHPVSGIVKKTQTKKETGEYSSWLEFFQQLPGKQVESVVSTQTERRNESDKIGTNPEEIPIIGQSSALNIPVKELPQLTIKNNNVDYYDFKSKLELIRPEEQRKFLEGYSEKLESIIENNYRLQSILQELNTDAQKYLLQQLSCDALKSHIDSSFKLDNLIKVLDLSLQADLITLLGVDHIIGLYEGMHVIVYHFLKDETPNKTEFLRELAKKKSNIISIIEKNNINNKYYLHNSFSRYHSRDSLLKHLNELASVFGYHYDAIIHFNSVTVKYHSNSWILISDKCDSVIIQTEDSAVIADAIFTALGKEKNVLELSTTIETNQKYQNYSEISLQQQIADIANNQTTNLVEYFSEDEQKCVFWLALEKSQINICKALINGGLDFFAQSPDMKIDNNLFNQLCEIQVKYNIQQLKQKIENTNWEIKVGGSIIQTSSGSKVVPRTIAIEWQHIIQAEQEGSSYYEAWKAIINVCKVSKSKSSFFRKQPAIKHYNDIGERKIFSLRAQR